MLYLLTNVAIDLVNPAMPRGTYQLEDSTPSTPYHDIFCLCNENYVLLSLDLNYADPASHAPLAEYEVITRHRSRNTPVKA